MRKIVAVTMVSLDGVIQSPGGPEEDIEEKFEFGGWTVPFSDEFGFKIMKEQLNEPFDLLLGRKTYEIFAPYWPSQQNEIAEAFNRAKKYVV